MTAPSLAELRNEIANLCSDISTGRKTLETVFADQQSGDDVAACNYVYVVKILERVPGVGKVAARRILAEIGVADRCSVGSLTDIERRRILEAVST